MRLAFVTSLVPTARPDTGFEIANAAIIEALRAAGHEVAVFGFARPEDELQDDPSLVLIGRIVIENSVAGLKRKLGWLAGAVASGLPVACAKLKLAGRGRVEAAIRAKGPFDAIVLNSVTMAGAFPALRRLAPTVLVEHNIEHVSARQSASHADNWAMRLLFSREANRLQAIEEALWRDVGHIWCLAEEDRRSLPENCRAKASVLPLVPSGSDRTLPDIAPVHDVGLIGTWTWEPNLIGLRWFLEEVAPLLPPSMRIAVAGRLPPRVAGPPNVALLGRVPDADAFLGGCRVIALASRAGTGVQLKTIETLGRGMPAVATSLSMRGLAGAPANVAVADDAPAFAAALAAQVAAVAAGRIGRLDGSGFIEAQRRALRESLDKGLSAVHQVSV